MPEGRTRGQTTVLPSDAGGVAQQPASARLSYSSTLSVRLHRRRDQSSLPVHGFPLALLGYHPRLRMVRLRRRRLCMDADEGVILCCCGRTKGGSGYSLLISSNSYSFIKEKRLYICLQSYILVQILKL